MWKLNFGSQANSLWLSIVLAIAAPVLALESDQFTLPPKPLADIGPEVSMMVSQELQRIIDETNVQIELELKRAEASGIGSATERRRQRAEELLTESYLAHEIYDLFGFGFPETKIEQRIAREAKQFKAQPALFSVSFSDSILRSSAFVRPLNTVGLVPTINMYGVDAGVDKIGHHFQQGYEYLRAYWNALDNGATEREAVAAAVEVGVDQERGVYGNIPSGAYSNADLAANFAGLMFYRNLTEIIEIDGRQWPPLFRRTESRWIIHEESADRFGESLLEPFTSDHLSEAMNPPRFDWTMRGSIRKEVRKRAEAWMEHHQTDRATESRRLFRMCHWFGEEYGHSGFKHVITVLNVQPQR